MRAFLLMCLLGLLALPVLAQDDCAACVPNEGGASIAPMVMTQPLKGVVTIVEANGRFYVNLGAVNGMRPGAELLLSRNGSVLGKADVLRVDHLDALVALDRLNSDICVATGDTVVVQYNPDPLPKRGKPLYNQNNEKEGEELLTIFTLLAIGVML